MNLQDVGWGGMDWVALAQKRDRCQVLVNEVINRRFAQSAGYFLTN